LEKTGKYVFVKLFKKSGTDDQFYIHQRISLTAAEFKEIFNQIENVDLSSGKADLKPSKVKQTGGNKRQRAGSITQSDNPCTSVNDLE